MVDKAFVLLSNQTTDTLFIKLFGLISYPFANSLLHYCVQCRKFPTFQILLQVFKDVKIAWRLI